MHIQRTQRKSWMDIRWSYMEKGIEVFHQSLLIFNPKWPAPDHSNKIIELHKFFCSPGMSVNICSSQYKWRVSQLDYNSIVIPGNQFAIQFINGLGADFTMIQNMIPLPLAWQLVNIGTLIATSRNHLAQIMGNIDVNKRQRGSLCPSQPSQLPQTQSSLGTCNTRQCQQPRSRDTPLSYLSPTPTLTENNLSPQDGRWLKPACPHK